MCKFFSINRLIVLGCLCLIFSGCKYAPYRYSFLLVEPKSETRQNDVVGQALNFEDDNVQFRFMPSPENIWVAISNKTDHEINLVRDKAEFIDHLGESHKVVYGDNFVSEISLYADNNMYVSPMRIDPDSEITGNVWINIWLDYSIMKSRRSNRSDIGYFMQPFLPRYSFEGSVKELKGLTFNLILPIDFGEYVRDYTFTFMIDDVIEGRKN